jgi:hypothetical protein
MPHDFDMTAPKHTARMIQLVNSINLKHFSRPAMITITIIQSQHFFFFIQHMSHFIVLLQPERYMLSAPTSSIHCT